MRARARGWTRGWLREPGISRSRAARLVLEGRVLVNGAARRKSEPVSEGGQPWRSGFPSPGRPRSRPSRSRSTSSMRTNYLLVVDKAAGMVVHPAPGHRSGTLVNALLHHLGKLPPTGGDREAGDRPPAGPRHLGAPRRGEGCGDPRRAFGSLAGAPDPPDLPCGVVGPPADAPYAGGRAGREGREGPEADGGPRVGAPGGDPDPGQGVVDRGRTPRRRARDGPHAPDPGPPLAYRSPRRRRRRLRTRAGARDGRARPRGWARELAGRCPRQFLHAGEARLRSPGDRGNR